MLGSDNNNVQNHPGSTAIAALIYGNRLIVGNIGDCRLILCRGGDPMQLSRDHTVSDPNERRRLELSGHQVVDFKGRPRLCPIMIEVTRSIGDFDMKEHGMMSDAEFTDIELSSNDEFLVMGSDGLFEK